MNEGVLTGKILTILSNQGKFLEASMALNKHEMIKIVFNCHNDHVREKLSSFIEADTYIAVCGILKVDNTDKFYLTVKEFSFLETINERLEREFVSTLPTEFTTEKSYRELMSILKDF